MFAKKSWRAFLAPLLILSLALSGCGTVRVTADLATLAFSDGSTKTYTGGSADNGSVSALKFDSYRCPPNPQPGTCKEDGPTIEVSGPGRYAAISPVLGAVAIAAGQVGAAAALRPQYRVTNTDNSQTSVGNGAGALAQGAINANATGGAIQPGAVANTLTGGQVTGGPTSLTANPQATAAPTQNGAPVEINTSASLQPGAVAITGGANTLTGGQTDVTASPQVTGGPTNLTATNSANPQVDVANNPSIAATAAPIQNGAPNTANASILPGAVTNNTTNELTGGPTNLTATLTGGPTDVTTNTNAAGGAGGLGGQGFGGIGNGGSATASPTIATTANSDQSQTASPSAFGGNINNPLQTPVTPINLTFAPTNNNTANGGIGNGGIATSNSAADAAAQANGGIATANPIAYGGIATANPIANGGIATANPVANGGNINNPPPNAPPPGNGGGNNHDDKGHGGKKY